MTPTTSTAGVLALQGDYQKHCEVLDRLGVANQPVRTTADFARVERLIIPGGESTVMVELLHRLKLTDAFSEFIKTQPVWGTCAGMILLADKVVDESIQPFGRIGITVNRNGYGRQVFSTVADGDLQLNGSRETLPLVFIRAPRVIAWDPQVTIHLRWNNDPVLLSQGNVLVSSFHPELTGSLSLHRFFVESFPLK